MQTYNPTPLHTFGASNTPNPNPTPEQGDMQWAPHHESMNENHKGRDRVFILIVVIASFILLIILLLLTGKSRTLSKLQASAFESTPAAIKTDDGSIIIATPQNGATIEPPFIIQGQAKGFWFNQGLFPVTIYDTEKKVVMKTYAIAQGDWADPEKLVPFKVSVDSYDSLPTKKAGHIVFKKANTAADVPDSEYLVVVEFAKKGKTTATGTTSTKGTKTTTNSGSSNNNSSSTSGNSSSGSSSTSGSTGGTGSSTGSTSGTPACRDDKDNDGDGLVDALDPGCHSDGNASNISSYEINKTSEVNFVSTSGNGNGSGTGTGTGTGNTNGTSEICSYGKAKNNPKNYNGSLIVPDGTPLDPFCFPQV